MELDRNLPRYSAASPAIPIALRGGHRSGRSSVGAARGRAPPRAHRRPRPRPREHPRPTRAAVASGALLPLGLRLRSFPHADPDRSTTMTAAASEFRPPLKRLKLGRMLDTLPERIALARRDQLDYAELPPAPAGRRGEPLRPRARRAQAAPGWLRAALPPRGLRLVRPPSPRPPPTRRPYELAAIRRWAYASCVG